MSLLDTGYFHFSCVHGYHWQAQVGVDTHLDDDGFLFLWMFLIRLLLSNSLLWNNDTDLSMSCHSAGVVCDRF